VHNGLYKRPIQSESNCFVLLRYEGSLFWEEYEMTETTSHTDGTGSWSRAAKKQPDLFGLSHGYEPDRMLHPGDDLLTSTEEFEHEDDRR
jgi:hypothetical protein